MRRRAALGLAVLVTVLLGAWASLVPLQAAPAAVAPPPNNLAPLLEQARAEGTVRVIVGLRLPAPFQPEGKLAHAAARAQRSAIAEAQREIATLLEGLNAHLYRRYRAIPYVALRADEAALRALLGSPLVAQVEEDVARRATLDSSTLVIGAPSVWAAGFDGAGQTVVVIDTGIDADHPFFGGRVVDEACFSNAGGTAGGISLCPNGTPSQTGPGASDAQVPPCFVDSILYCSHGSHVAGIAVGAGPSFNGVAPGANVISIQVFTRHDNPEPCAPSAPPCISSWTSDEIAALDHTYTTLRPLHTLAAVNMSLGGGIFTDQTVCDTTNSATKAAIDTLRSAEIATVIAAGNGRSTNGMAAPGCISSAVAVSATWDDDRVVSFSDMHEMVELLAPGAFITSSFPDNSYATIHGTSMSAPHVAGAWAILKSLHPTATVSQTLDVLLATGVPVTDTRVGGFISKPRLQLDAAVGALVAATPGSLESLQPPTWQVTRTLTISNQGVLSLTWTLAEEAAARTRGALGGQPACSAPAEIPWVTLSSSAGTTLPGEATPVTLTFDSTGHAAGLYTGTLCLTSNDHFTPLVVLPLTMTVQSVDFSDLGSGYGVAWHTGDGSLRQGAAWSSDMSYAEGNDDSSDDGITLDTSAGWQPGESYTLTVTVTGGAGYLAGWFDWNQDGSFETPTEKAIAGAVPAGPSVLSFTIPSNAITTQAIPLRFRLYPSEPFGAEVATGAATGGEVEDYRVGGPLVVTLDNFTATAAPDHILLAWETTSELNNLGFNLYRNSSAALPDAPLNAALIPSQAPGSSQGASYAWRDQTATPGATYFYWLEDVDTNGRATRHGPLRVTTQPPTALTLSDLATLRSAPPLPWLLGIGGLLLLLAKQVRQRPR